MGTGRSQLGRDREDVALRAPTCGCSYPSGAPTPLVLLPLGHLELLRDLGQCLGCLHLGQP